MYRFRMTRSALKTDLASRTAPSPGKDPSRAEHPPTDRGIWKYLDHDALKGRHPYPRAGSCHSATGWPNDKTRDIHREPARNAPIDLGPRPSE
jgi:hypothetical protein